jgi:hypothetical protein
MPTSLAAWLLGVGGALVAPPADGSVEETTTAASEPSDWSDVDWSDVEGFEEDDLAELDGLAGAFDAPDAAPGASDLMTGSFRLMGAFMHFDDEPLLFPQGDDGVAVAVGRLIIDDSWDHVDVEINIFGDLSRSPTSLASTGGAFAAAGSIGTAYRHPYLTIPFWRDGAMSGTLGVDRAVLGAHVGRFSFSLGRFPVNHSVASFFTPNDFFAPFSATAVNRIYKPGVDAARANVSLGAFSSVEVVGVLGWEAGTDAPAPTWGRSAVIARASTLLWGFEWAAMGGKLAERWMAGGSFQGDIGRFSLRGEGHVGIPDLDGDGRSGDDLDNKIHGRLSAGPSLMFAWKDLTLGVEYGYFSDGASEPADYLTRAGRFYPDDLLYLGEHYLGVLAGLTIIPVLRGSVLTMISATDGSGLAGLSLSYSVADEADLIAGAYVPWGAGLRTGDGPIPIPELGSEFGLSPVSAFLEMRVFF